MGFAQQAASQNLLETWAASPAANKEQRVHTWDKSAWRALWRLSKHGVDAIRAVCGHCCLRQLFPFADHVFVH
ncbi:hypothetical protein BaRGS_00009675 [Batillaria attramentaria]|uniref:Uncharacterized protein n=1 Tax=Batillaria attramentaria TaxID=370345 RepID=A0ABD0LJ47_9CAEN